MDLNYSKVKRSTSFNIMYAGMIIGNADVSFAYAKMAIEIFPYASLMEKVGLKLTEKKVWSDFRELPADEDVAALEIIINGMLKTMISGYVMISHQVELEMRKEVFGLSLERAGKLADLIMIVDLKPFVTCSRPHEPGIFVHEQEEYDLWRFDIGCSDEMILGDISAHLGS